MPTRNTYQKKNTTNTSFDANKILRNIKDSGLVDQSKDIVKKAATILEEEVAKGIVAAKEMQKKISNSQQIRMGTKNELVNRFRKDAHDLVDSFADLIAITSETFEQMVDNIGNTKSTHKTSTKSKATKR